MREISTAEKVVHKTVQPAKISKEVLAAEARKLQGIPKSRRKDR